MLSCEDSDDGPSVRRHLTLHQDMSKVSLDVPEEPDQDQEPTDEEQGTATAISFFTAAR